ncbi:MAG: heavy metal translocating P-type ATPase [Pseudomonadota bacterium]
MKRAAPALAGGGHGSAYAEWVVRDGAISHLDLLVPDVHCAGCIHKIERTIGALDGVRCARVNLSTKRLSLDWEAGTTPIEVLIAKLDSLGFAHQPFERGVSADGDEDAAGGELLRALAVAGFAAGNVMLLSVSVWSGADAATRDLFHWLSALIALPATAYAGRPFFRSAFKALAHSRLNMDVPISIAVILAAGMSLFETITSGPNAYFDACVMLLFFLLSGRYLDHMMRARARSAVTQLLKLAPQSARVVSPNGTECYRRTDDLEPGTLVSVLAGERVPADGRVVEGLSDLDRSIVTGELVPESIGPGRQVEAGTLNLTGPLRVEVTAAGPETFLSRMIGMMEEAEQSKLRYVRMADWAAGIYAPLVHLAAAIAFVVWFWATGDWHVSLLTAIAVLIITCPCALGLAVPAVQMVACGRLFRRGILVKDGGALERLAEVDTVVLDKTGTLTTGAPELCEAPDLDEEAQKLVISLARRSSHPLSRALAASAPQVKSVAFDDLEEMPGLGLKAVRHGRELRLGSHEWCFRTLDGNASDLPSVFAAIDGRPVGPFRFRDELRADAIRTIELLRDRGLEILLVSGDLEPVVSLAAGRAGIADWRATARPGDKAGIVAELQDRGRRLLMVGDGTNDAPALATAHVSMAPSEASDVGRMSAGLVFTGAGLGAVAEAVSVARQARRLIRQNFALAALYNLIAVPVALAGLASPLVAAIAMSASSLIVTGNALRLGIDIPPAFERRCRRLAMVPEAAGT